MTVEDRAVTPQLAVRWYIGRYGTREQAERVSARYGDDHYPNRTVEPEQIGIRTDWLIFVNPEVAS